MKIVLFLSYIARYINISCKTFAYGLKFGNTYIESALRPFVGRKININMKVFIFIFSQILLATNLIFAQLNFDNLILKDENFPSSQTYNFNFKFKNDSSKTITITKVETSCSCTITKLEKNTYAPNETGKINGVFNIGDRQGLQEKEGIVHTDDISQPQIRLTLKINILNPIEIKPRLIYWEKDSKLESKFIRLVINDPKWKMDSITCDSSKFTTKNTEEDGKYTIEVTPVSTGRRLRDAIKIELMNDKSETKIFAIYVLIK